MQVDVRAAHDAQASAASAAGFVLPAGLPSTSVTITGAGGAPRVRIVGPHGQVAAGDAGGRVVDTARFVIVPLPHMNETLIGIKRPGGGRWTTTPQPGAPAILGVSHANGLPPARITATVHGHGRARELAYRIRPRAGQTVTFAERAGQVFHVIGNARGLSGTLRFTPAVAPGGRRQIVALISLSGVESQTLGAGRYIAPAPPRAGAPKRVRVSRRGSTVVATWGPAANAHGYAVTVTLSDGRRIAFSLPAGRRVIGLPTLMRGLGARVTVMAIGPDGNPRPSRGARLAPAPPPDRVRGITATRTNAGVVVRWRPVRGAVRYLVTITVGGPTGARYVELAGLARLRPSTDLARLKPGTTVTITVRAMNADVKLGPAGSDRYRATRRGRRP